MKRRQELDWWWEWQWERWEQWAEEGQRAENLLAESRDVADCVHGAGLFELSIRRSVGVKVSRCEERCISVYTTRKMIREARLKFRLRSTDDVVATNAGWERMTLHLLPPLHLPALDPELVLSAAIFVLGWRLRDRPLPLIDNRQSRRPRFHAKRSPERHSCAQPTISSRSICFSQSI